MQFAHVLRALRAITTRELLKFVQQRGRLLSALVRPLIWLAVFAAGFYNVGGGTVFGSVIGQTTFLVRGV